MSIRNCEQCGAQNDDTRVYCLNCGTRLPAAIPVDKPSQVQDPKTPGQKNRGATPPLPSIQPRKNFQHYPQIKKTSSLSLGKIFPTAVWALILACLFEIARKPDNVPPPSTSDPSATETLSMLRTLASSRRSATWIVNQSRANQALATTLSSGISQSEGFRWRLEFQRAFVLLNQGNLDFGIEEKFFGHSFYFQLKIQPASSRNALDAKFIGGTLGRLPVDPRLIEFILPIFQPTLTALAEVIGLLRTANSAIISPQEATLSWLSSSVQNP